MFKKPRKSINLICLRVAISNELLKLLRDEAEKESRSLSAMARLLIERGITESARES